MTDGDVSTRRLKALLEQLLAEDSARRSQARVAARTGLSESMVSKILSGQRKSPTAETIGRVVRSMKLDPAYFFDDPDLEPEPDYRDFVRARVASATAPMWAEFEAGWADFGRLTGHEREALRGLISSDHSVRRWTDWVEIAEWLIAHRK